MRTSNGGARPARRAAAAVPPAGQQSFEKTIPIPRTGVAKLNWTSDRCSVESVELRNYPDEEDIEKARREDPERPLLALVGVQRREPRGPEVPDPALGRGPRQERKGDQGERPQRHGRRRQERRRHPRLDAHEDDRHRGRAEGARSARRSARSERGRAALARRIGGGGFRRFPERRRPAGAGRRGRLSRGPRALAHRVRDGGDPGRRGPGPRGVPPGTAHSGREGTRARERAAKPPALTAKGKLLFVARLSGLPDRLRLVAAGFLPRGGARAPAPVRGLPEGRGRGSDRRLGPDRPLRPGRGRLAGTDRRRRPATPAPAASSRRSGSCRASGCPRCGSGCPAPARSRWMRSSAEALRIEAGRPRFGEDIDETNLPDEAGLDAAISATKGCYVGQEIVARRRTYGRVNRRLVGFRFPAGPLARGTVLRRPEPSPVRPEPTEAGRVTSVARSPRFGWIGLGFAFHDRRPGAVSSAANRLAKPSFRRCLSLERLDRRGDGWRVHLALLGAQSGFALFPIFGKLALATIPAMVLAAFRVVAAAGLLALVRKLSGDERISVAHRGPVLAVRAPRRLVQSGALHPRPLADHRHQHDDPDGDDSGLHPRRRRPPRARAIHGPCRGRTRPCRNGRPRSSSRPRASTGGAATSAATCS